VIKQIKLDVAAGAAVKAELSLAAAGFLVGCVVQILAAPPVEDAGSKGIGGRRGRMNGVVQLR
jgi:hypothetical protein